MFKVFRATHFWRNYFLVAFSGFILLVFISRVFWANVSSSAMQSSYAAHVIEYALLLPLILMPIVFLLWFLEKIKSITEAPSSSK